MARQVTSVTKQGKHEPFELQVSEGQIAFHKNVYKFGLNEDVGNSLETIWEQGGLYTYLTSASTLYVSSSSANDTAGGTGAQNVTISGLDADYNEVSITVDLSGQTGVQLGLANNWIRVNRGIVNTAGATGSNEGVIYVGIEAAPVGGVPAIPYTTITIGNNQTLQAFWTVPTGYTAYIYQTNISTGNSSNTRAVLKTVLTARPFGGVFNTKEVIVLTDGNHLQDYNFPIKLTEKSDIEFRAESSRPAVDFNVSASLNILYVLNGDTLDVKNGN